MLIFDGVLLAVILSGLTNLVSRRASLSCGVAMTVVAAVVIGFFVGFGFVAGPPLASQASEVAQRLPEAANPLRQQFASPEWIQQLLRRAPQPRQMVASGSDSLAGEILGVFSTATEALISTLIVLTIGLYLIYSCGNFTLVDLRNLPHAYQRVRVASQHELL